MFMTALAVPINHEHEDYCNSVSPTAVTLSTILYVPKLAYKVFTGSCICLAGCFCCHKSSADFGGGGLAGLFNTSIALPQASSDWLRGGGGGFAGRTVEEKLGVNRY